MDAIVAPDNRNSGNGCGGGDPLATNMAGIVTPLAIGCILEATGSFV